MLNILQPLQIQWEPRKCDSRFAFHNTFHRGYSFFFFFWSLSAQLLLLANVEFHVWTCQCISINFLSMYTHRGVHSYRCTRVGVVGPVWHTSSPSHLRSDTDTLTLSHAGPGLGWSGGALIVSPAMVKAIQYAPAVRCRLRNYLITTIYTTCFINSPSH